MVEYNFCSILVFYLSFLLPIATQRLFCSSPVLQPNVIRNSSVYISLDIYRRRYVTIYGYRYVSIYGYRYVSIHGYRYVSIHGYRYVSIHGYRYVSIHGYRFVSIDGLDTWLSSHMICGVPRNEGLAEEVLLLPLKIDD
ncbi:hypothetical protein CSUI_003924 [Cystoisospora suis]|uniref:Transmembrane protein n=1 Tax=Cystoisospora suis TaxID=483139 RepID=A0A2C6L372_9APIC|nr:hypothetical protein CSUI_003924 [Cystoisospora suis]